MTELLSPETIEDRIFVIRDHAVMLDADLAHLYGIPTRHLNMQVDRNRRRFPGDFMFRLTEDEWRRVAVERGEVRQRGGRRYRPYAFTELGAGMLASVLRGPLAARVTVEILRAFRRLRPDDGPVPDAPVERKAHGLFAAIRDAVLIQADDIEFTTGDPYTYFVQVGEDGPIKIGWTRNLSVRLRSFATMLPLPLRLLGVIPGNVEDWCHTRFAGSGLAASGSRPCRHSWSSSGNGPRRHWSRASGSDGDRRGPISFHDCRGKTARSLP